MGEARVLRTHTSVGILEADPEVKLGRTGVQRWGEGRTIKRRYVQ